MNPIKVTQEIRQEIGDKSLKNVLLFSYFIFLKKKTIQFLFINYLLYYIILYFLYFYMSPIDGIIIYYLSNKCSS